MNKCNMFNQTPIRAGGEPDTCFPCADMGDIKIIEILVPYGFCQNSEIKMQPQWFLIQVCFKYAITNYKDDENLVLKAGLYSAVFLLSLWWGGGLTTDYCLAVFGLFAVRNIDTMLHLTRGTEQSLVWISVCECIWICVCVCVCVCVRDKPEWSS